MKRTSTNRPQNWLTISLSLIFLLSFANQSARADHLHFVSRNSAGSFDQDLTALTNATLPNPGTGVVAFSTEDNGRLHVFYSTTDLHVHQFYFNGATWIDQDLTSMARGPLSHGFGGISGFIIGHAQHVFYLSSDLHVHHLFSNNSRWTDEDATALGGGPVTDFVQVVAFETPSDQHFHVFYTANNSTVLHELNFNGSTWSDLDLSVVARAAPAARGWMSGFATGNQQHLFYGGLGRRNKLDMIHLSFNGSKWVSQDVSAKVRGLPLNPAAGITAFPVNNSEFELYCVTNDMDVHQFTLKNGVWTDIDLWFIGADEDFSLGQMAAFKTPNNHFHLYYPPNDLHEALFSNTGWSDADITTLTGGAIPDASGMAGFAIKNQEYVFYVGEW